MNMATEQNNLFIDFQQKKKQVCLLAEEALKNGCIDELVYKEIISKIEQDILTIGVIGQMKCGKSTFLNSFLFGDQLLPAATTPMTAALSIITYGNEKGLKAEFYSSDEWEELKNRALKNETEVEDPQTRSSIKAAKELYEKSIAIRSQLPKLLGTTKTDDFNNLIEYVGADGKYVSIVKSVTITLPEEWLKGVEIVDTPGFNDPILSREERTQEFLKRADVVLMMLYAGRAFDATDCDILFNKVQKVGIGKVILAVNKYDIQLAQGESPEEIKGFVMDELKKALRQHRNESVSELLDEVEPVLVSAQMALLAKMSLSQINKDADLKHHYDKICDDFELTSQRQLLKWSRIVDLENKVRDVISNQKEQILIRKPVNQILQEIKNTLTDLEVKLTTFKDNKANLEMPDNELETKIENLQKTQRKIERKINNAESELAEEYDVISDRVLENLQNCADEAKNDCLRIIEQYKKDTLKRKIKDRLDKFREREFPSLLKRSSRDISKTLENQITQLTEDVESVIERYFEDSDEIAEDFRLTLKGGLKPALKVSGDAKKVSEKNDDMSFMDILFLIPVLPIWEISEFFNNGRDEAREYVDNYFSSIKWKDYESQLKEGKEDFINTLNGDAACILIKKLVAQAEDARTTKEEKEKQLLEVKKEIEKCLLEIQKQNDMLNKLKAIAPSV